jgi:repressor LexA
MAAQKAISDYLTRSGRAVLIETLDFQGEHGYPPTIRDLCERLNLASPSTVHTHLERLRRQGYVTWVDGQVRTLVVTEVGRAKVL